MTSSSTEKSSLEKDATPLLESVASSALIVTVPPATCVFIPSPPKKLKLVPKLTSYTLELSSPIVIGLSEPGVVTEPPNAIASPFIVIDEFASLAFSIEPANCVFETPPAFIVTAPDDTSKSALH